VRTDPVPEVRGWALRSLHWIGTERARRTAIVTSAGDRDERIHRLVTELFPDRVLAAIEEREPPQRFGEPRLAPLGLETQREDPSADSRRDPSRPLRLGGWLTASSSYGLTVALALLMLAIEPSVGAPQLIPVIGPVVSVALFESDEFVAVYAVGLVCAVAQLVGLAVAIAGEAQRSRLARDDRRRRWARWRVAAGPAGPGAAFSLAF
jgi:hypothetical protein